MIDPQATAQLRAFCRFFAARNAPELQAAFAELADWVPQPPPPVADWQAVEFNFNRLFVGPGAPLAPPFASVYLEPEPQLMGPSTIRVRRLYELAGLHSPAKNTIPEDHISYELDGLCQISVAARQVPSAEMQALRDYFLTRHVQRWLPRFIRRVRDADHVHPAILFVLDRLEAWLLRAAAEAGPSATTHYPTQKESGNARREEEIHE